jgi:cytochrome c55X
MLTYCSRLPVSLLLAVLMIGLTAAAALALSDQRRDEMIHLVRQDCGSCHGLTLKGGLGSALLPENLEPLDAATIAMIILEGKSGTPMPAWKNLLTPDEALWIARHLKQGFPP